MYMAGLGIEFLGFHMQKFIEYNIFIISGTISQAIRFLATHLNTRKQHLNLKTIIFHSFLWFQEKDSR